MLVNCSRCGARISSKARYCPECGQANAAASLGAAAAGCIVVPGVILFIIVFAVHEVKNPGGSRTRADSAAVAAHGAPEGLVMWVNDTLNVRSGPGPGTEHPVTRQLLRGASVMAGPEDENGWAKVVDRPSEYIYARSTHLQVSPL